MADAVLRAGDYALVQASRRLASLWQALGEIEDDWCARRISSMPIDSPIFVTGLARSGTTMVLSVLAQADGVATHRYRDFPFLFVPLAWNWFQDRLAGAAGEGRMRPHGDRIRITKESAEAFEEPLWQFFFPWVHDPARCHVLGAETRHPAFEACFARHLRKIMALRGGTRYVSKGNYNLARVGYLARLFPDARFVIPVREPVAHVHSLVRQHALFSRYATQDRRVPQYLEAAGHYEFGPQRRAIHLDPARIGEIEAAWRDGDEYRGYARQWAQVYAQVERMRRDPALAHRMLVVRYEDACVASQTVCAALLGFCGLSDRERRAAVMAATLSAPPREHIDARAAKTVWSEVEPVAASYGYAPAMSGSGDTRC